MFTGEMKIAMIAAHSCPVGELGAKDTGGMSVYIREVAREMSRQGHCVDVYTRFHDPADPVIIGLGGGARLIHIRAGQEAQIDKLEVYSCLSEFTRNLEDYRENNGLQYDLIFSHYWLSGLVGQNLQPWWRVPHVIKFHTLGSVKNTFGIGEDDPTLRIAAEKELIDSCQSVIASTERGKDELVCYYDAAPGKIGIVPCGVNMEIFHPVDRVLARLKLGLDDEKVVLFVGRIDPLKGVDRLLGAIPYLRDFPSLRLVLIGGDTSSRLELEKLERLSAELGIQGSVEFQGTVPQKELPYFYSAADVCVVPSYYETFGLVALEALACGTPVVTTDVGDMKNIIEPGRTGYLLDGNEPVELADNIACMLSWPSRDVGSAYNIRASVKSFDWASVARRIINELRLVCDRWPVPVMQAVP